MAKTETDVETVKVRRTARERRRAQERKLSKTEAKAARKQLKDIISQKPYGKCDCRISVAEQKPHPKYGDRVPYFDRKEFPDPDCQHAKAQALFEQELAARTPVAPPPAPVPFEMDESDSADLERVEQALDPASEEMRCTGTTKAGTRCKNYATVASSSDHENARCGKHPL